MDLSIIIVNWNSKDCLRDCLRSLEVNLQGVESETIVVDNASYDGSREMIAEEFPWAEYVQSAENLGFARANNLGFERSKGRAVLFLNPDTEVLGTALQTMLEHLDSSPKAGAVGCRLLNSDRTLQTSCIQPFPTILNQVLDIEALKMKFPNWKMWGIRPLFSETQQPEPVEVVSGACLMMRRRTFREIGLFSDEYFMFGEDLDLCRKAIGSGRRNEYVPAAQVVHHGGQSSRKSGGSQFSNVLMRQSIYLFLRKTRGAVYAWCYRFSLAVAAVSRLAALTLARPFTRRSTAVSKWLKILRWSVGLERWAQDLR